jgi:hypothetical protein
LETTSPQWSWDLAVHELLLQQHYNLGRGLGQAMGETVLLLRGNGPLQVGNFLDL